MNSEKQLVQWVTTYYRKDIAEKLLEHYLYKDKTDFRVAFGHMWADERYYYSGRTKQRDVASLWGIPVYVYRLDAPLSLLNKKIKLGAAHASEVAFTWGHHNALTAGRYYHGLMQFMQVVV